MYRNTTFHKNDTASEVATKQKNPRKWNFAPHLVGQWGRARGWALTPSLSEHPTLFPPLPRPLCQPEERQVPRKVRLVFFQLAGLIREINSPYKICPVNAILAWHVAR